MEITEKDIILMGHGTDRADVDILSAATRDSRHRIRIMALSALIRRDQGQALEPLKHLASDEDWHVRRRVAELAIELGTDCAETLLMLCDDSISLVAETACFALGEIFEDVGDGPVENDFYDQVVNLLITKATHDDPLVRESAVASLGNIGDDRARETVIAACSDKAPIRRRAVVALAAFTGDDVDEALDVALNDHDWQVRQAAEDISGKKSPKE